MVEKFVSITIHDPDWNRHIHNRIIHDILYPISHGLNWLEGLIIFCVKRLDNSIKLIIFLILLNQVALMITTI